MAHKGTSDNTHNERLCHAAPKVLTVVQVERWWLVMMACSCSWNGWYMWMEAVAQLVAAAARRRKHG